MLKCGKDEKSGTRGAAECHWCSRLVLTSTQRVSSAREFPAKYGAFSIIITIFGISFSIGYTASAIEAHANIVKYKDWTQKWSDKRHELY